MVSHNYYCLYRLEYLSSNTEERAKALKTNYQIVKEDFLENLEESLEKGHTICAKSESKLVYQLTVIRL